MDDLQWSDLSSVDLLEALIKDEDIEGLLLLGTCRHDEISCHHSLSNMLRKLENGGEILITNITVTNLSQENMNTFVSNILKDPTACSMGSRVSTILYQETGGNIFFILQFLANLYEKGALYRD